MIDNHALPCTTPHASVVLNLLNVGEHLPIIGENYDIKFQFWEKNCPLVLFQDIRNCEDNGSIEFDAFDGNALSKCGYRSLNILPKFFLKVMA